MASSEKPVIDPELVPDEEIPTAGTPEEDSTFVRSFTLPAASFFGADEEIETYGANVIREAQALGLRPESVKAGKLVRNRAESTVTIVFTAS